MKPVTTIDDFPINAHIDWARRQEALAQDPLPIQEAPEVALHPALLGHEAIYLSQWELLLEWNRQKPWAHFEPPPKYRLASRRLFSFCILPHIQWIPEGLNVRKKEDEEEENINNEEKENAELSSPLKNTITQATCFQGYPFSLFEIEKTKILNLIDTSELLNELLAKISALKLKYQKG